MQNFPSFFCREACRRLVSAATINLLSLIRRARTFLKEKEKEALTEPDTRRYGAQAWMAALELARMRRDD
jgi:hypothetical protein